MRSDQDTMMWVLQDRDVKHRDRLWEELSTLLELEQTGPWRHFHFDKFTKLLQYRP